MKTQTKQQRYKENQELKGYKRLRMWVHEEDFEDVQRYIRKKNQQRQKNKV